MSAPTTEPSPATRLQQRLLSASSLTERHERLAGVSTAIFEGGDGPPMILLHGQGEFWAVWLKVFDDLIRTHRVVAVDLPGHGGSLEFDGKLDTTRLNDWLDELIDATCDRPPVLVGHLLGGAVAGRYTVAHGDRVARLVLVDSLGLGWYRPTLEFAIPMVRFMANPTAESRDRLFDKCFVDFDDVGEGFGELWDDLRDYALDRARTPENESALKTMMPRVGIPAISSSDLGSLTVPTILIHGRQDLQVPLKTAERASERYGWPLYVIEGAADDPAAEQPEAFIRALRSGLAHGPERNNGEVAS